MKLRRKVPAAVRQDAIDDATSLPPCDAPSAGRWSARKENVVVRGARRDYRRALYGRRRDCGVLRIQRIPDGRSPAAHNAPGNGPSFKPLVTNNQPTPSGCRMNGLSPPMASCPSRPAVGRYGRRLVFVEVGNVQTGPFALFLRPTRPTSCARSTACRQAAPSSGCT